MKCSWLGLSLQLGCCASALAAATLAPPASARQLPWIQVEQETPTPRWKVLNVNRAGQTAVGSGAPGKRLLTVTPKPAQAEPDPSPETAKTPQTEQLPPISIGVGVRGALQDTNNVVIQGAVRVIQTGDTTISSFSIRPAVIFPDSSCSGSYCNNEYRVAATVDFFQSSVVSFYAGGGVALNKDAANGGQGDTYGMFSGGIEINLSRNFAITGNLNLVSQPSDPSFGGLTWADAESSILFTARF